MGGVASGSHMIFQLIENKGFMGAFEIGLRGLAQVPA
jgi:hypothetical protein